MKDLSQKLVKNVSEKLGCNAKFSHWQRNKDNSETPVFIVPDKYKKRAKELLLTIN